MDSTNADRQRRFRASRLRSGLDQLRIWVRAVTLKRFTEYRHQHGLDADAALTRLLDDTTNQERK